MPHTGKLMPNLDEKTTKMLNLTVLQRIDPFVEEILITASHVTFYEFNIDTCQWSRKDVEGSFFVVKRNAQPRFQFIVMNRRNTENLVEDLLGDFEYEVQVPYLLYRNASQEVNGIWFYNARECEDVANLFNRILNAYSKAPAKSKLSSTKSEFEELEAVPTMAVMDGPLEPIPTTTTNASDSDVPDDPAFVNFFSTPMNIGGAQSAAISGRPYHFSSTVNSASLPQTLAVPTLAPARIPSNVFVPTPVITILDSTQPNTASMRSNDLVKPSSFFDPIPSSLIIPPISLAMPTAPPLNPLGNLHQPYGTPLLQPFPPPTPSPSLTPAFVPMPSYGPVISRENVKEALQRLVQDDQFIDMVYRAVAGAHQAR